MNLCESAGVLLGDCLQSLKSARCFSAGIRYRTLQHLKVGLQPLNICAAIVDSSLQLGEAIPLPTKLSFIQQKKIIHTLIPRELASLPSLEGGEVPTELALCLPCIKKTVRFHHIRQVSLYLHILIGMVRHGYFIGLGWI